ncbi:unnamed protein product [Rhizophagus irregularis]|nr:unnamed protein product [Rhizophagus irregularis]CAB4441581.1 unnamed protein product [Rhizophagus irregularis]
MASLVENSSQFESCVYNKLKSMKLCVSRTTRDSCGDNGIDIFGPFKEHTLLVQCKNYTTAKVGINEIREFEGANSFEYFNVVFSLLN